MTWMDGYLEVVGSDGRAKVVLVRELSDVEAPTEVSHRIELDHIGALAIHVLCRTPQAIVNLSMVWFGHKKAGCRDVMATHLYIPME